MQAKRTEEARHRIAELEDDLEDCKRQMHVSCIFAIAFIDFGPQETSQFQSLNRQSVQLFGVSLPINGLTSIVWRPGFQKGGYRSAGSVQQSFSVDLLDIQTRMKSR